MSSSNKLFTSRLIGKLTGTSWRLLEPPGVSLGLQGPAGTLQGPAGSLQGACREAQRVPGDSFGTPGEAQRVPGYPFGAPGEAQRVPGDPFGTPGEAQRVPGDPEDVILRHVGSQARPSWEPSSQNEEKSCEKTHFLSENHVLSIKTNEI